jgi:uncharacterized protein YndB with AHSA1/START domain
MRHVHAELRIDAPAGAIFALASDPDRLREWNPYQRIDDVRGPLDRVGTTLASTLILAGHEVHSLAVVTEVIADRLVRIHGTGTAGAHSEWTFRFDPAGGVTRTSLDIEYDPDGVLGEVADLFVHHGALDRAARHMLENLAALAEAEARVPA